MLRFLAAFSIAAAVALLPALRGAEPAKSDADAGKTPTQIKEEAALREKLIAQKFRAFEISLLEVVQRLEKSANPEDRAKAVALRQALDAASKSGINTRIDKLMTLLKESKANNLAEIRDAIEQGERLTKDMQDMLELLLKDSQLDSNRALIKRLSELIKTLEAIIRAQKIVRAHTERRSLEQPMIAGGQNKVTGDTENFAKDMEDKNQPGHDRLPGKELVKQAIGDQHNASGNIAADKNDSAVENQTAAIDKLLKVREALDQVVNHFGQVGIA
jgi:hypothetical protein